MQLKSGVFSVCTSIPTYLSIQSYRHGACNKTIRNIFAASLKTEALQFSTSVQSRNEITSDGVTSVENETGITYQSYLR